VLLGARNACGTEQVSFEIGFEGGVGVDRSKMSRGQYAEKYFELASFELTIRHKLAWYLPTRSSDLLPYYRYRV